MKAGIYLGKEKIEIREVPIPEVGPHDVLIQNLYSSICGTDVAVFTHGPNTGHRITTGGEFGHETISKVAAIGEEVTDFEVGQRVYPYPLYAKGDTSRAGTLGAFSEYILVPHAKLNHSLYLVPNCISDKIGCLIEPFTVGCRAARRSQPHPGEKAVIFGCGTIGVAAAIALKWFGIEDVMVCDISDYRLSVANRLGFQVCNTNTEDFKVIASKYFGTASSLSGKVPDIDIYLDAAGAEGILDQFMELGKIGSRFVSVAVNNVTHRLNLLHLTYAQQSIIGSGGYMPEDVNDVLAIMESTRWDIASIITHEYPLDKLETGIRTAARTDKAFNVVIRFEREN